MYKGSYTLFFLIPFLLIPAALGAQNLGVSSIISPTAAALNCASLPRTDNVTVRITNFGTSPVSNVSISYKLNNNTSVNETYTGTINGSGGFFDYTFTAPLTTSSGGASRLKVYTSLPGDVNRGNDTAILSFRPRVNTYPYYESFESDDGGFTAGGANSSWVWGARNKANTGAAADGVNCWTNGGLTGYYNNSDASYIQSPCYDFSKLKYPYIGFQFVVEVEYGWESVTLEYSTNGGSTWGALGNAGEPNNCETQNWFNNGTTWAGNARSYPCSSWGSGCPNGICGGWVSARHCLSSLAGQAQVQFRWRFASSGTQCTAEGFALDSLVIGESTLSPFSFTAPANVCQNEPAFFNATVSSCHKNPRWNFGDTTPVSTTMPTVHIYTKPGTYTAMLVADGLCGKVDTIIKTVTVAPAPTTSVTAFAKNLCQAGSPVSLSATPAGGIFYIDGNPATSIDPSTLTLGAHNVVYEYKAPGPGACKAIDSVFFNVYMPKASITNLNGQYCPAAPSFKLQGNPAGGIFTIDGINDSIFNPGKLSLGTHTVLYAYRDSIGCPASATQTSDISNTLVVNITGLSNFYCAGEPAVTLTATPTGGTFYLNGAASPKYDPATMAPKAGLDTVIYYYSDGACSNADTVTVNSIKNNPSIPGINPLYCYDAAPVNLTATPAGGIFTLDGANVFSINPKTHAPGSHKLVYTYQDPTYSCLDSATTTVTIDKPVAKITGLLPNYCIDATPVTFTANPTGGAFTLNNAPATQLNPGTQGLGKYTLIYTYTNTDGCTVKDTQKTEVVGLPTLQYTGFVKNLCFNSNPFPLTTNPSGGVFTIDGLPVNSTKFDPSLYQPGKHHVVQYSYVDFIYGCQNSIKDSVFIGTPPPVAINGLNTQYCNSDALVQLNGAPAGGQFTVNGTAASNFNPKTLGPGTHTVKYSYTDPNGCFNEIDQLVSVITNPGDTIFPGPVIQICKGEKVTLNVSGSLPGIWSTSETTNSITVQPPVNSTYWFRVNDCVSYIDTVTIIVHNNPSAGFDLTPKEGFMPLDITARNKTQNVNTFKWFVDGKEFTNDPLKYTFENPGVFKVKLAVMNANGCVDTVEQLVSVFDGITIPNVFSPNGDLTNETFGPITKGTFTQYSFKIFNRWGTQVFEASRPEDRWDGSANGNPAPDGTYYYILVAENLRQFKLEGTVNLVR